MSQVVTFIANPREYIVHNAGDEPVTIMYGGETRILPPVHEVITPAKTLPAYSGKDAEGEYIPGSLVIADIYEENPSFLGGSTLVWSAAEAIKQVLGIDTRSGTSSGPFSERGISVLPANPPKDLVRETTKAGRERYERWRITEAERIVFEHNERNAKHKALGMPEIGGDERYIKAHMIVAEHRKLQQEQIKERLGVKPDLGVDVDKLVDQLLDNDEFNKALRARITMATGRKANKPSQPELEVEGI